MSTAATEDLIILQILTRLPIKSLIRFSCVSKRLSSIILSDQRFAKSQFKFAGIPRPADDAVSRRLFHPKAHLPVQPTGACRLRTGLVQWHEGVFSFYPKMPDFDRSKTIVAPHYWGFGYVSATDDYKVVVEALFADSKMYVEVFSSRANSWKRIESTLTISSVYRSFTKTKGALSNETLHWLHAAWPRAPECYRLVIAAFDLTKEEFREIPLPVFKGDGTSIYSFIDVGVVSGGCLCVCRYEGGQSQEHIQLWVMREYDDHESWTKLFRFTVNAADHRTKRLIFHGDSSIVMLKFNAVGVENELERIYLQCKDVGDCCDRYSLGMGLCDVIQYEETLLWLNDSQGLNGRPPDTRINTCPESKQK